MQPVEEVEGSEHERDSISKGEKKRESINQALGEKGGVTLTGNELSAKVMYICNVRLDVLFLSISLH